MSYIHINPYVRFARICDERISSHTTIAPDHRIFFCLSDSGILKIGEEIYNLKKGSVIFWKAGIRYCDITEGEKLKLIGINFDFFASDILPTIPVAYVFEEFFDEKMILETDKKEQIKKIPDCIHIPFSNLKEKFEEVLWEYEKREMYYEERCSAILKDILISVFRVNFTKENNNIKNNADRILKYVHKHYNEDITNIKIAEYFSYHPNYIGNLIKQRTGMSLHKYLIDYRMHMAIGYIKSGEYTITEVAEMVGYKDIKHFSKSFKLVTGFPPKAYLAK